MTPPDITAVICTRNRAEWLKPALESLLAQDLPRDRYEILVVDNASTDSTPTVCATYAGQGVRYVLESQVGLSHARNAGLRHARADLIAYLDDDAEATPGWLSAARTCFLSVKPSPVWVGGPVHLIWSQPRPEWIDGVLEEALGALDLGAEARWLSTDERLVGCNSCFSKTALEQAGGFNARLGRIGRLLLSGEETELQRRFESRNQRLYYHPDVKMTHHVALERLAPAFFYRRFYWGGITDVCIRCALRAAGIKDLALPSTQAKQSSDGLSRLHRLLVHGWGATGIRGRAQAIKSRVYLSYVAGCLVAPWYAQRGMRAHCARGEMPHDS